MFDQRSSMNWNAWKNLNGMLCLPDSVDGSCRLRYCLRIPDNIRMNNHPQTGMSPCCHVAIKWPTTATSTNFQHYNTVYLSAAWIHMFEISSYSHNCSLVGYFRTQILESRPRIKTLTVLTHKIVRNELLSKFWLTFIQLSFSRSQGYE